MKKYAIILAGGEGRRAGGSVPKQMLDLCGRPVLWWSMHAFYEEDPTVSIILVMHPGLFTDWDIACSALPEADRIGHTLCCGGRTRTESVGNALLMLKEMLTAEGIDAQEALVAVHDAARPLITSSFVKASWEAASPGVTGVPALACSSSLRELAPESEGKGGSYPVDRSRFREVQTPQTAVASDIIAAYSNPPEGDYTDDASLLQACGCRVRLFEGLSTNIKITYPPDIHIAATILELIKTSGT